jgi:hypothetical protein
MTRAFRAFLLSSCAVLVGCMASAAMAAEISAIVDTPYVAEAIKRNAIVWDTRSAASYKQGHIPGAVNIDDIGVVLRDENTEDYIARRTSRGCSAQPASTHPAKSSCTGRKPIPTCISGL